MFQLSIDVAGACFAGAAERFAQRERVHSGADLDLTVAAAIAQAMGGSLDVAVTGGVGGVGGVLGVRFPLDLPMDEMTERRLAERGR